MPAPIEDPDPQAQLQVQLQVVGKAFDALLLTLYRLTNRHNDLKHHAEDVFKQYTAVTRQLSPQDKPHAMEVQQRLLDQQKQLCLGLVQQKSPVEEQSLNSMDVIKTLVSHQNVDETAFRAIVDGVKGYKALLRDNSGRPSTSTNTNPHPSTTSASNSCILARGPDPSLPLEQDFTTNGTQGNLHCPFSKPKPAMSNGNGTGGAGSGVGSGHGNGTAGSNEGPKIRIDTCGNPDLDPIKADIEERRSSTTPSARTSGSRCPVSRCPIRYLDKHSPEEIAEYVERHKHEIPRSHAICVKRYQRDPQNMRQLDAKYGGLINMISGLSAKHQAFLPAQANGNGNGEGGGDDGQASHSASTERVEKWAENVDPVAPIPPATPNEENGIPEHAHEHGNTGQGADGDGDGDDNRESHFDRPLREVRVGESPSRPWGIHVPLAEQPFPSIPFSGSASGPLSPSAPVNAGIHATPGNKPVGRCPFGHDAKPKPQPEPEPKAESLASPWANWGKTLEQDGAKAEAETEAAKPEVHVDPHAQAHPDAKAETNTNPPHITFNGPVFFGYSAEQTALFMQQLGNLATFKQ